MDCALTDIQIIPYPTIISGKWGNRMGSPRWVS